MIHPEEKMRNNEGSFLKGPTKMTLAITDCTVSHQKQFKNILDPFAGGRLPQSYFPPIYNAIKVIEVDIHVFFLRYNLFYLPKAFEMSYYSPCRK